MKKKTLVLYLFLIIDTLLFGISEEEFDKRKERFKFITESEFCNIYRDNSNIIIRNSYNPVEIIELEPSDICLREDGYQTFTVQNKKYLIIQSNNFINIFRDDNPEMAIDMCEQEGYRFSNNSIKKLSDVNSFLQWHNESIEKFKGDYTYYHELYYFKIAEIRASSYYIEKTKVGTISYKSNFLNLLYYWDFLEKKILQHNPWVPGKDNNTSGIGEYLEIEFTEPKDNIVILNGYVDLEKRYLYKANNRVKKAVLTSLDKDNQFEIEYDFDDYVHFSEINFPKSVNKVRFTIKEVYKGEKWDDTCITAVITRWEE